MPRAPRQCPSPGCSNPITTSRYCADHTQHHWNSSTRGSRLPFDWHTRRTRVRDRAGGQCEHTDNGVRCTRPGTDCDHITAGDDHSLTNLQWLCAPHHKQKTQQEATAGLRRRLR